MFFLLKTMELGIDPEYQKKIFMMFQGLHKIDEYDGTGIGLSSTKKLVVNHKGFIWVKSELDKGYYIFFLVSQKKIDKKIYPIQFQNLYKFNRFNWLK